MRKFITQKSVFVVLLVIQVLGVNAKSSSQCKAWIVQSIPTDMPHLPPVSGVLSTGNFSFISILVVWVLGNRGRVGKMEKKKGILFFFSFLLFGMDSTYRWGLCLCGFYFLFIIIFIYFLVYISWVPEKV